MKEVSKQGLFTGGGLNPFNWFDTEEIPKAVNSVNEREEQHYLDRLQLAAGQISNGEYLGRKLGHAGGGLGDMTAAALGMVTPDVVTEPLGEGVGWALNKAGVGDLIDYGNKEYPRVMRDLGAVGGIAEITPVGRALKTRPDNLTLGQKNVGIDGQIINHVAQNINTLQPNFYSGNPIAKAIGVTQEGIRGVGRSVINALNPRSIALHEQLGISSGLLAQTKNVEKSVKKLQAAIASGVKGPKLAKLKEQLKSDATYQKGALAFNYFMAKQTGQATKFLEDIFGKEHVIKASTMDKSDFADAFDSVGGMPDDIMDRFHTHVASSWGLDKDNLDQVHMILKNPTGQHSQMNSEIYHSPRGAKSGYYLNKLAGGEGLSYDIPNPFAGQAGLAKNAKMTISVNLNRADLANPDTTIQALKLRRLSADQKKMYVRIHGHGSKDLPRAQMAAEGLAPDSIPQIIDSNIEKLTPKQRELYYEAKKVHDGTPDASFDEVNKRYYWSDSHNSQAKELGGVNMFSTLDEKGNIKMIMSDGHDMFGVNPAGGDSLITVLPPYNANIFSVSKGTSNFSGHKAGPSRAKIMSDLDASVEGIGGNPANVTGANTPFVKKSDIGTGTTSAQAAAILEAARVTKPRLKDYGTAFGRANTARMLTGSNEEQEPRY